jgi:tetratricopeptide (TPR) repeat protein
MLSPAELFNLQENSTGDCRLKNGYKLQLLLLLIIPLLGFGQQDQNAALEPLLAKAQQAQAGSDYATAARAYKLAVKIRPDVPELWANLGLMEHETANYADAIQSFQHAYKLKPSLYVPNLFLGIDFVHIGKAKEAIPFLLTAEKINDEDSQPHLALGRVYSSLQEFPLAVHEFTNAIRLDPKLSTAWFSLGIAYLDQVENDSRKMSEKDQNSSYAKSLFAESLATQSRYLEAVDLYKQVLASSPQPPCTHGQLGFVYLRQHDNAAAVREFKSGADCSLAVLGQSRLDIDAGANEDALKLLNQLWKRDPGFVQANASTLEASSGFTVSLTEQHNAQQVPDDLYDLLFSTLQGTSRQLKQDVVADHSNKSMGTPAENYAAGRYGLCADQTKNSLKTKNQSNLCLLAACAFLTGDYALSSDASAVWTAMAPQSTEAFYWSIKADEKLAFQALERYEQLEPHSERSHLLLGDIYIQRERYDDAQAEYQKALELSPNDPAALLGSASAYFRNGNISKTIETARLALNQLPEDPEINLLMGEALVSRHDFLNTEPFLEKGLNAKQQMLPHVHALLGRVYAETGKSQQAINELKLGLASDEDGSVHYQLARLYRQAGDENDARTAIEQMKAIQQRRREGAVIAFKDSHPSGLDDEP